MNNFDIDNYKKRMLGAIDNMKINFQGLRSGRASSALVDNITLDAYGQTMKIKDVASVNVLDARSLKISVWDANLVHSVEKGIINSTLELTPVSEGQVIRINLPELTAERRSELAKNVRSLAEEAKISIRNIRQDAMNYLKKLNDEVAEDEVKKFQVDIQKLTDDFVVNINDISKNKENEILQI
jgi:ribosome recycling factor